MKLIASLIAPLLVLLDLAVIEPLRNRLVPTMARTEDVWSA